LPQLCCSLEMNKNKKAWHAEKKTKAKNRNDNENDETK
jgi:hypothetical protein